jgi:MarR-like DNA-binding transcriptional regulator SgrR of sgrS sRNA
MSDLSKVPTVGNFPISFPRDTTEVNVFLEHVLLGQTLEPLIETGVDGSLIPAVASRWEVLNGGTLIKFQLRKNIQFSDGKIVTASDVSFTLKRHINSPNSQSKPYLKKIRSIRTEGDSVLLLELDAPYVAIFKALSRDQLGIVPAGWKFNPKSAEPFIGTGPYRIIKNGSQWQLVENENYRNREEIRIPKWNLLFFNPKLDRLDSLPVPDLVPLASYDTTNVLMARSNPDQKYEKKTIIHFIQSSAWFYPHGANFHDPDFRKRAMFSVQSLIRKATKKFGLEDATGVIPQGIAGHLPELQTIKKSFERRDEVTKIKISIQESISKYLCDSEIVTAVEAEENVKFSFTELPLDDSKTKQTMPDIIAISYAGGFQDPEGFLTVISSFLQADTKIFLGQAYHDYELASSETSWSTRAILYKTLSARLISDQIMIPGWRPQMFSIVSRSISHSENQLRYAPKFKDYFKNTGKEEVL